MPSSQTNMTDYIRNLIIMMECLNEPWGIKDLSSRHVYMNKAAYLYTNTPMRFDIEGRLDDEFPASWTELSDDLKEHDRLTENSEKRVTVIETHYWYGKKTLTPFVSEKIPIFDENKLCIGTMWNARPLDTRSPLIYIDQKKPTTLQTELTTNIFTKSELDIIFLILQRLSNKEIARKMNISPKTIENRIYIMYQKAEAHSLPQFEEFCRHLGIDGYIPNSLIEKGIQFI
ncbi:helix-turn-helix transcriptional regulator [Pectobacterium brasiliense]|uniref:LuxR family transcriptional regulator n=1 Tax=Pectobacterium brasiliense TaxID=180957 RepID=A0A0M2F6P7_9GAMM|nr:LuxR C-terminal-related transcriptional regulator [Pectobacterium brasiliense]KGA35897.1 LuxR family transcriptional regulator [Pectobacterium brasiliense]KMK84191.1 LuxR family transcriptional regulator [Pectobacterium brasiliense ICMP 19477]MBN3191962.1 helix-turn-helix transcriptional regulator [Pectobacterium brasiliense]MCG5048982.1 helix-turn-helix transcriptional regulator [Pectobacterium brasiliense]MCL6376038.1 LuxR family transcriptional regulator [Pectobacterium brasiliense]